jgi:hypothetical protein
MLIATIDTRSPWGMTEGSNVEMAHRLAERGEERRKRRVEDLLEIAEVLLLALVAIATAWSGYQAAKWDGREALLYGISANERFAADAASTSGGQQLIANASMLTAWLQARSAGDVELQRLIARRFTPDYRVAFEAWLAADPFGNESAPPGPGWMPEFKNPSLEQAKGLNAHAATIFAEGTESRETADSYVRDTVLLASVLFVIAIAQRFKVLVARIGANAIAFVLLVYTLQELSSHPRL